MLALCHFLKITLIGDMSARLEPVVSFQQLMERVYVFLIDCYLGNDALVLQFFYALQHFFGEPFGRILAVERVVNLLPGNREVTLLSESFVTKHFLLDARELDV